MTERINDIDKQMLAIWSKSFISRYERWKKKDLFAIAIQTMPKQVKTENVIDNIIKLKAEFAKKTRQRTLNKNPYGPRDNTLRRTPAN